MPAPPPFSAMNSRPARSKASTRARLFMVVRRREGLPSTLRTVSKALMVGRGTPDASDMRAAIRTAQARMEVTGDAWGVCMSYALKGAWAAAKASRTARAH